MEMRSKRVLIGFAALFLLLAHGGLMAGKIEPPVPEELWDYARAQGCVDEAGGRSGPDDVGPRYIYGVLSGSKFGYDKKQDNAAIVCLLRSRREFPVIGETFVDEATVLLKGVEGKFSCKSTLPLLSTRTASVSVKDGIWKLKEFHKLDNKGEAISTGASISISTRMIIIDWYEGRQLGFICHKGDWYATTLRID